MDFDLEDFLNTDIGTETADATAAEGPSSSQPPSGRDSSIDQLISMMGHMQRDMVAMGDQKARKEDRQIRVDERQTQMKETQDAYSRDVQDLLNILQGQQGD